MLTRLGHALEWTASAVVGFSVFLAGELAREPKWIIFVLLISVGVVFLLIRRVLRYIFAGFTGTLS
jgi:hypothetical protein